MFRNVLIGVDGTSHGRDAIALATVLAAPSARLTLVHVQPGAAPADIAQVDFHPADPTFYAAGHDESQRLLEREREAAGVDAALITVPGPSVGPALHAVAEEQCADLLVVGACKHGLAARILIGDDARATVKGATCAVAIAPTGYAAEPLAPATIGVGFDFSAESDAAVEAARDIAAAHASNVIALDVVAAEPIAEYLTPFGAEPVELPIEILARHRAEAAKQIDELDDVEGRVVTGARYRTLAEFARGVDLLVVGSRSHGLLRRLVFGSTSLRLARHTHHPIVILPRASINSAPPEAAGPAEPAGVGAAVKW
jgi:nucleotide-binding universal stress UspA family protein